MVDQNLIVDEYGQPGRKDSLQVAMAEAFSVNYKRLVGDVNENRKYGIYFNIDCQNFSQVQEKFGIEKLRSLMTGFGAKVWFNPGELESAKYLESVIGTEIISQRKTTYQTRGGSSSSYEEKERPLFSAARVLKMKKQEAIIFADCIGSGTESNIPWHTKVKVEPLYVEMCEWAKTQWPQVQKYFVNRSPQMPVDDILEVTRLAAEEFLPSPMSDREKLDRDDAACRAEYEEAVFGSV